VNNIVDGFEEIMVSLLFYFDVSGVYFILILWVIMFHAELKMYYKYFGD
jgi:hypothetical protein